MNLTEPAFSIESKVFYRATFLLFLVCAAGSCLGDTFTVTRINNTGPGSLPVIINTANATPGQHIIEFSVTGTINLVAPLPLVTNSLTINGRGNVTISGQDAVPIFSFAPGTTNNLSGLGLTAAARAVGDGGAISNAGVLVLDTCALGSNNASTNRGGALYSSGVVSLNNCFFSDNQAAAGGAIYCPAPLTVSATTFLRNAATDGFGGALCVSNLVASGCTFDNNSADATNASGGAVHALGSISVQGSLFTNNSAINGNGGALFSATAGLLSVSNSSFASNRAGNGGALFSLGSLSLLHCAVSSNQANLGFGGGVYCAGNSVVSECAIYGNVAAGGAGQRGTTGGGGGGGLGGGVFTTNGTFSITNCTLSGNLAVGGTPGVANANYNGGGDGGGNNGGKGGTSSSLNNGNSGGFGGGGGGALNGNTGNSGAGGFGGGAGGGINPVGSRVGAAYGGAMFVASGTISIVNVSIISNSVIQLPTGMFAGSTRGGGIYCWTNLPATVVFLRNTIVAGNYNGTGNGPDDLYGTNFSSTGFNLIGNSQGAAGLSINDYQNEPANLGPLQDNGGATLTHALLSNSLALGGGTGVGAPATDQRGVIRPTGWVDIGAFQFSTPPAVTITTQPLGQSFSTAGGVTLTVGASGSGLSYQWQFNGTNMPNSTSPTLNLTNLTATNAGAYRVVVSSSAGGSATSQSANLFYFGDLKLYSGATLGGPVGQQFRVDYADVVNVGATNWMVLSNLTLPSSPYLVIDPSSPSQAKRFYRAVPLP